MENTIELKHPKGKQSIIMDKTKYELLKKAFLNYLKKNGESNYTEIWQAIAEDFTNRKIKFEGSVQWHMEWIKLDLEANNLIERIPSTIPKRYALSKK